VSKLSEETSVRTPTISGAVLKRETARVQAELIALRDEYLPALFGKHVFDSMPSPSPKAVRAWAPASRHLVAFQQAVDRLGDAVPFAGHSTPLREEDFKEFMFQKATPAYSFTAEGVRWEITVFMTWSFMEIPASRPPFLDQYEPGTLEEAFVAALARIKTWLFSLSVKDTRLWNALCMVVPLAADADPAFAKLAVDLETWRSIVRTDRRLSAKQRRELLEVVDGGWFQHVVNNALLHVFAALGNNHFLSIRDYLDHPCLWGAYNGLMPDYLFALLFHKVAVLQRLAAECPPGLPGNATSEETVNQRLATLSRKMSQ